MLINCDEFADNILDEGKTEAVEETLPLGADESNAVVAVEDVQPEVVKQDVVAAEPEVAAIRGEEDEANEDDVLELEYETAENDIEAETDAKEK